MDHQPIVNVYYPQMKLTCSLDEPEKLDGSILYLLFEALRCLSVSIRNFQDLSDGSDCQVLAKIQVSFET